MPEVEGANNSFEQNIEIDEIPELP